MNARVVKSERVHLVPHATDDDSIQQKIRRSVVADGDHEPCSVTHGENRSVVQILNDSRARHLIDFQNRDRIVERELSLCDEIVNRYKDRNLDETRRRKFLVAAPADANVVVDIDYAVADNTVMCISD